MEKTYKNTDEIKEHLKSTGFTILLDICYGDDAYLGGYDDIAYFLFKITTHEFGKKVYITGRKRCVTGKDILRELDKIINWRNENG